MRRLTPSGFERAAAFMATAARPIERAAFEHAFRGAPAWPVVDALRAYQNPDGGFGHGLEPDAVTAASGALATSVALRRLVEVGVTGDHPVVTDAVTYLRAALDPVQRVWRIVPVETGEAPHAPWWDDDGLSERFGGFRINPKADLLAQLYALRCDGEGWLDALAEDVVRDLAALAVVGSAPSMHDLIAAAALLDAPDLPVVVRHRLHEVLLPSVETAVVTDPAQWSEYVLRPTAIAPRPASAFAAPFADAIEAELDFLVGEQADDGGWWPTWDWGRDEEVWTQQRVAWAGVRTLDALRTLHAFERIDTG